MRTHFWENEKLPKLCRNCAFPQYFNTRKLGEIRIFYVGFSRKKGNGNMY